MAPTLTVVGCSPAVPDPGGVQSGYLVGGANGSILLDCGTGVLPRLRRDTRDGWPDVVAIVLTHFHLDHWGDIVPWALGLLQGRGGGAGSVPLHVPAGGRALLDELSPRFAFPGVFERAFPIEEYQAGQPFRVGDAHITATRVPHYSMDAYALSVALEGRTLAYSGDSGPSESLAAFAAGADLFLCEATLADGVGEGALRGHLSVEEAVAAFEASGAAELLLTHRPCELERPAGLAFAHDGLNRPI